MTAAFVDRLFNASVEMCDVLSVYLGDRLGLYRALQDAGPATPAELADAAGIDSRYAREWLEQQAVTGILEVDDQAACAQARRYTLPPSHAEALVDPDSPWSIAPLGRFLVACAKAMPRLVEAYRTGGGVSWAEFGDDASESQGDFNRPWLMSDLGSRYLPSVADVDARLRATPPARVADVACGVGWSSIAIARAYPDATVDGFDLDEASIARARAIADTHGVGDRVSFHVRHATAASERDAYDLVVMIEALHDLARPVETLQAMRTMLRREGCAIIADERTAERFTAPGDVNERLFYGFSVLSCLPAGMAEQPSAQTGAVMRPDTVRSYATQAGFSRVAVLEAIDHPLLRFYRLDP